MKLKVSAGEILYILVGSAIAGAGCSFFIIPGHLTGGGVSGLGTIAYHLFHLDAGIVTLVLNVPIVLFGMKVFGWLYGIRSIVGAFLFSFWISFFGYFNSYQPILSCTEPMCTLLGAIFGGVLLGGGIGLVMRTGANTGGTDILAQIMHKYTPFSMDACTFLPDAIIILMGFGVFGLEKGLFTLINLYVSSVTLDFVAMGIGTRYAKSVAIFSEKHEQIEQYIIEKLERGGTLFSGTGIFSKEQRSMLYAIIPNQQIYQLVRVINHLDPDAFVIVSEAYQVMGEGFSPMERSINAHPLESGGGPSPAKK